MQLFSHHESFLGLDIGTSSVKLVELQREGKSGVRLVTYASANGANPLVEGKDGEAVARTATLLREMVRRSSAAASSVIAALPSLSVFSSVLTLPEMSERDLEHAVVFAAKNYVPSPLKDVVLGWTVIKDTETPQAVVAAAAPAPESPAMHAQPITTPTEQVTVTEKMVEPSVSANARLKPKARKNQEVFLTAAPRDLVQRYSQVIERLDLRLIALEIESFPLSRSLLRGDSRAVLLVDIGDLATSFSVVDRGYLRLNQSIDIGGASLTTAITQALGVTPDEAEKRKRAEGLLSEQAAGGQAAAAMIPVMRDIVERSQNIRRLYEQKSRRPVSKVVLIGGGANLKGLPAFWSDVSGLATEVGNPWQGIRVPAVLNDRLRILGPSFAVAVGLALREFEEGG